MAGLRPVLKDLRSKLDDFYIDERTKTVSVMKEQYGPKARRRCALCGRTDLDLKSQGERYQLETAHIIPLQDAGETDRMNLIPLCKRGREDRILEEVLDWAILLPEEDKEVARRLSLPLVDGLAERARDKLRPLYNAEELGCHRLFDKGLVSVEQIQRTRSGIEGIERNTDYWDCSGSIRQCALSVPLRVLAEPYSGTSSRKKGIERQRKKASGTKKDVKWFEALCELIARERRLERRVQDAYKHCLELEAFLREKEDELPEEEKRRMNIQRFWYEYALTCQVLDQPQLSKTKAFLAKSEEYNLKYPDPDKARVRLRWAMSHLEWLHTRIFMEPEAHKSIGEKMYNELSQELQECISAVEEPTREDKFHAMRWKMNGLMFQAQLDIKALKHFDAYERVNKARTLRNKLDVTNGWTVFHGYQLSLIEGCALALFEECERALVLLTRVLDVFKVYRDERPQGYKDLAYCAAWALKQLNHRNAEAVHSIAQDMVDGRSGFWPLSQI